MVPPYPMSHTFTKGYIEKLKELNDYRINGYLHIIESLNQGNNNQINGMLVIEIILNDQNNNSSVQIPKNW